MIHSAALHVVEFVVLGLTGAPPAAPGLASSDGSGCADGPETRRRPPGFCADCSLASCWTLGRLLVSSGSGRLQGLRAGVPGRRGLPDMRRRGSVPAPVPGL